MVKKGFVEGSRTFTLSICLLLTRTSTTMGSENKIDPNMNHIESENYNIKILLVI